MSKFHHFIIRYSTFDVRYFLSLWGTPLPAALGAIRVIVKIVLFSLASES